MPAYKDPDDNLVALFKYKAEKNEAKTLQAGRPIFDDVEVCEIRSPGSKDVKVFPSTALSTVWVTDPETGEQRQQSYAERFSHQYRQFKEKAAQTKSGTPLEHAPFLSAGRRAELRALNVYTVEALADIEGAELKNLGPGGRDMKNQAIAFIEASLQSAPNLQLQAELEVLRARNQVLEEDLQAARAATDEYAAMSDAQLRDFVVANTGGIPLQGNPNRKTLVRMAQAADPQGSRIAEKVA
jgi:hypothetical protein